METREIPEMLTQILLPGLPVALSEIPLFARRTDGSSLGVIVFNVCLLYTSRCV